MPSNPSGRSFTRHVCTAVLSQPTPAPFNGRSIPASQGRSSSGTATEGPSLQASTVPLRSSSWPRSSQTLARAARVLPEPTHRSTRSCALTLRTGLRPRPWDCASGRVETHDKPIHRLLERPRNEPELQHHMAQRCTSYETISAGHSPYISQPAYMAAAILNPSGKKAA